MLDEPLQQTHDVFAAGPEAVPQARHLVGKRLTAWGLDRFVAAFELAVGELVTNAVQHGEGPVEVILAMLPDRVRAEVHDHGGGQPTIRPTQTAGPAIGGWGLRMVDQLVDIWGTHRAPGRTVVWVEQARAATAQ